MKTTTISSTEIPPPRPTQITDVTLDEQTYDPANRINHKGQLYEVIMQFFLRYPEFVEFCKHIKKLNNKDTFIGFLSRDCYFTYQLYKHMYPELVEDIDYAYIYSSRICYSHKNKNKYYDYIKYYIDKRPKLLLIDMHGSGHSYSSFINKFNINTVYLLFLKRHNSQSCNKTYVSGFTNNHLSTTGHIPGLTKYEAPCRAPHPKISSVILNTHTKQFDLEEARNGYDRHAKFDKLIDANVNYLLTAYSRVFSYMSYHENIRYLTNAEYIQSININNENIKYKGILFLDIDDTITNIPTYEYIRTIVSYCDNNTIKMVLVTARQTPFSHGQKYNQTVNTIIEVLDNINYNYTKNQLIVWYNPYTWIKHNSSSIKVKQIMKTCKDYNIPVTRALFIDDTAINTHAVAKKGMSTINIGKKGISKLIYDKVIDHFDKYI